ncbi:MAG: UPF0175 family protein [Chloroflexi bacterium]|nr:UPF0175 family protein [Chloroflexota bacterium]
MAEVTTRQLNIRVSPDLIHALDEISEAEQLDRTTVVRRLLQDAIQEWRLRYALRLYREDRITKERAAELAGVSLYEILDLARREAIPPPLTVHETLDEIKRLERIPV